MDSIVLRKKKFIIIFGYEKSKLMVRKTTKYLLKKGNKILYAGITDDFDRRFNEHEKTKEFGHMIQVGRKTTRAGAENWESKQIERYQKNHNGAKPSLNKTKNGR